MAPHTCHRGSSLHHVPTWLGIFMDLSAAPGELRDGRRPMHTGAAARAVAAVGCLRGRCNQVLPFDGSTGLHDTARPALRRICSATARSLGTAE